MERLWSEIGQMDLFVIWVGNSGADWPYSIEHLLKFFLPRLSLFFIGSRVPREPKAEQILFHFPLSRQGCEKNGSASS